MRPVMVVVAQLVRALDCGSRGRRFETGLPPFKNPSRFRGVFSLNALIIYVDSIEMELSKKTNKAFIAPHYQTLLGSVC